MFPPLTLIICAVTGLMGASVIFLGWFLMEDSVTFQAKSIATEAQVVAVERLSRLSSTTAGQSSNSLVNRQTSVTFQPIVAFTDNRGHWEEATENLSIRFDFEIGQTVPIRYIPGDPPRVRIDSKEYPYIAFGFFALIGGGFLIGSIIVGRQPLRRWRIRRQRAD